MATGLAHHVFGEASVNVGLGSAGALAILGYSVDGVDIEFNLHVTPVHDDRYGPEVPADEQDMLIDGTVRAQIVWWDEAVRLLVANRAWISGTEGVSAGTGNLFGAGAGGTPFASPFYYRLLINVPVISPTVESPFNFLNARLTGSKRVKVGTKHEIWDMSWYWKGLAKSATSLNNIIAFNRVNT